MNSFVADPHWGGWIIWYFFLGGIAAGAYFVSTLIEWVGDEDDRAAAAAGYWIAFPLIVVCGVLLIADLDHPARFWHMLVKSEVVAAAWDAGWPWSADGWKLMFTAGLLKYWSPMSIGSWAISLFGLASLLTFVAAWRPQGRVARLLRRPYLGNVIRGVGCGVGFFVAAYTGALLTATNQPLWSDTAWIASLFLTSAASTGIAAMILINRRRAMATSGAVRRLGRADLLALGIELVVFAVFLVSLGSLLGPVLATTSGKLLVFGVLVVGLLVPLAIHLRPAWFGPHAVVAAAVCVLLGGFILRYSILTTPPELLSRGAAYPASDAWSGGFGPEGGRARGHHGADPGNRAGPVNPRSKVFGD